MQLITYGTETPNLGLAEKYLCSASNLVRAEWNSVRSCIDAVHNHSEPILGEFWAINAIDPPDKYSK